MPRPAIKFRKPKPWVVNPSRLASPFDGMWRSLEVCVPVWEPWTFLDIAPNERAHNRTFSTAFAGSMTRGQAQDGRAIVVTTADELSTNANPVAGTGPNRSCMATFTLDAIPADSAWIWGMIQGGAYLHIIGVTATGAATFYEVTGGAISATSAASVLVPGKRHCLVGVAQSGTGMKLFLDGGLVAANATGSGFLSNFSQMQPDINPVRSPFNAHWAGKFTMGCYWNKALTDGEAFALSADPFGLIRPVRRGFRAGVGSAAGGGARSFVPAVIG